MNISFENLEKIPELLDLLNEINSKLNNQVDTKWLSLKQLIVYVDYSKSSIYKKIDSNELIENVHYYKQEKKYMFDKYEIDNWIRGRSSNNSNYNSDESIINDLLKIV